MKEKKWKLNYTTKVCKSNFVVSDSFKSVFFLNYNKFDNLLMKERLFSAILLKHAHTQICVKC